jgi:chitinase
VQALKRAVRALLLVGGLGCLGACAGGQTTSEARTAPRAAESGAQLRIVGYVTGWALPPVIHAEKVTHINFAFARIDDGGRIAFPFPNLAPALKAVVALKAQNPRLRVIVSVGGWTADGFSDAALTENSRDTFARSAVDLLRESGADGIDLDWEYPGQGVAGIKYRAEDKQNFTLLLKTMREHLDAASGAQGRSGSDRYLLTIASADREYFDHTEMDKLHVYLDWINVMTYDFFNSLTPTTGHHAGLYAAEHAPAGSRNADASIRQHLAAGIPPDKLVLGVAFYGRGFAGVKPEANGLNQPYEHYEGDHFYADLATTLIGQQGYIRYWDARARAPWLWNATTGTFITYDDPQSIREKAAYVRAHRLGGMMFWQMAQDRDDELLDVIAGALRPRSEPSRN